MSEFEVDDRVCYVDNNYPFRVDHDDTGTVTTVYFLEGGALYAVEFDDGSIAYDVAEQNLKHI